jgi:hypothetical protein
MRVEYFMDCSIIVAALPEDVPQEQQLLMKAALITQSSSSVYQCGKGSIFAGWVVVGARVQVEFGMGRFTIYLLAQRTIGFHVNM